jgi:Spy/CpxP family protein refolding chaperone
MTHTLHAGLAALALVAGSLAHAQSHGAGGHSHAGSGPYAGMQNREVKSLSEQQMADLRAGKGMSLALPAELNGYPGPAHTLELATALGLTDEQRARTQSLFLDMQREAKAVGEEVIQAEAALDALFRQKTATRDAVTAATARAAQAQGRLRDTHLRYHLSMMDVLSAEQVVRYARLRGY